MYSYKNKALKHDPPRLNQMSLQNNTTQHNTVQYGDCGIKF